MMRSRSQQLAEQVWTLIGSDLSLDQYEAYGQMALRVPTLIRTAGLAQALAFLESKTQPPEGQRLPTPERKMLNHLARVVLSSPQATLATWSTHVHDSNTSLQDYMRLTQRSLEAGVWFKRFAQSKLGQEVQEGNE